MIKSFNYVQCEIIKGDGNRLLNLCSRNKIDVWDIDYKDCVSFKIKRNDVFKLKMFLRKSKTRLKVVKKNDYMYWYKRFLHNLSIIIGMAIAFALIVFMKQFIWDINISGNEGYTEEEISKYLENESVARGVRISKVDTKVLEIGLKEYFEEITWLDVSINGNVLYVSIKEADIDTKPEIKNNNGIFSLYNGVVESIVTRGGTPKVKKGDFVNKGDLLIDNILYITDDYEENITEESTFADGDIFLYTTLHFCFELPVSYEYKKYTGKISRVYELCLKDTSVSVNAFRSFKAFDTYLEKYRFLGVFNYYILKEYKIADAIYDYEEAEKLFDKKIQGIIETLRQNQVQIKDYRVNIDEGEDKYILNAYMDVIIPANYECREAGYIDE